MNNDTRWLARLAIDQGLVTRPQCIRVRDKVGENADLMTFAQELIDSGAVTDVEKLERLAEMAVDQARHGSPPNDPLLSSESTAPFVHAGKTGAPAAATVGGALSFPFEKVASLNDQTLAGNLRELLKATAGAGASDLHLSTGAKPFIRKNRALSYISQYTLTAGDALRLNTALPSEGQKQIFLERRTTITLWH